MQRERRLTTKGETPEAPTKKLSTSLTDATVTGQEASPDTAIQLSRIETILDSIVGSLMPLVGAR